MFIMPESCSHMKNKEITEHIRVRSEQPEELPPETELGIPRLCGSSQVVYWEKPARTAFLPCPSLGN